MQLLSRLRLRRGKDGAFRAKFPHEMSLDSKTFGRMVQFSADTEDATRRNLSPEVEQLENAIATALMYHGLYLSRISDGDEDTLEIAQLMLLCRFTNALYATARLTMMGLVLEAMGMFRSALEALQLARLVHLDGTFAKSYLHPSEALRPVEVRKELEKRGHDVQKARAQYSSLSTTSHIGGFGESLLLEPVEDGVAFNIGGYVDVSLQRRLLVDCHLAIGEYVAFHAGVRQEDVDVYHAQVKAIIARTGDVRLALAGIGDLIELYRSKKDVKPPS
ncbi:MAG: hypothetical protein ACYCZU_04720 [Devosia sp.]